ncbi:MAG: dihydrolipoamide acetyltransferase family protein [Chloroflexota bacterium]
MYADVVLPNLGFGMEEGRLISWLKKSGDRVRKGEPIAEIESDKATVELESVVDGVIAEIMVAPDTVVPVNTVLARIQVGESTGTPSVQAQPPTQTEESSGDSQRVTPVAQRMAREHGVNLTAVTGTGPGGRITREDVQTVLDKTNGANQSNGSHIQERVMAAPAVRKLARDNHIDLRTVHGTGPEGRVKRADVEMLLTALAPVTRDVLPMPSTVPAVSASSQNIPDGDRREVPLSNMRQAIAHRLVQSAQEAPHIYVTAELDLTHALSALPKGIGINNLLLYLTVQALHDQPDLNATFENGKLYQYSHVNLAIAVALKDGLITPVLQHADDFSLSGLAERTRALIDRAREGRLRMEELSGGTFTVSNLGIVKQIERFTAIINPPQVAILAVGAAKERPVVIDGGLHIRTIVHLTLSADHRIIDGLSAARFLEAFDNRLQAFVG